MKEEGSRDEGSGRWKKEGRRGDGGGRREERLEKRGERRK